MHSVTACRNDTELCHCERSEAISLFLNCHPELVSGALVSLESV